MIVFQRSYSIIRISDISLKGNHNNNFLFMIDPLNKNIKV